MDAGKAQLTIPRLILPVRGSANLRKFCQLCRTAGRPAPGTPLFTLSRFLSSSSLKKREKLEKKRPSGHPFPPSCPTSAGCWPKEWVPLTAGEASQELLSKSLPKPPLPSSTFCCSWKLLKKEHPSRPAQLLFGRAEAVQQSPEEHSTPNFQAS